MLVDSSSWHSKLSDTHTNTHTHTHNPPPHTHTHTHNFQRTQSLVASALTEDQDFLWQKLSLRSILNFGLFLSNNWMIIFLYQKKNKTSYLRKQRKGLEITTNSVTSSSNFFFNIESETFWLLSGHLLPLFY